MPALRIEKKPGEWQVAPQLRDYEAARESFSWAKAAAEGLQGLPGGRGLNIGFEAVDRHALGPRSEQCAIRFLQREGGHEDFSYGRLYEATNRFANLLASLGLKKGDRVFGLLGRVPELYVTALGALKAGAVFCPLFSAFGPEPIQTRLSLGEGKLLVTTSALYQKKVAAIRASLPHLKHVILVDAAATPETLGWDEALAAASPDFIVPPTDPEDLALLHFTSGTTGKPKGALHVHQAILAHHVTGRLALDFHEGDIFWCTADPGWVTGTSYGILSPLSNGVTMIVDAQDFDAQRWYQILEEQR
ncbi:acetate--CoA ligase, partial [Deltaproteobacteria bacterium PRO3]|nr:acetate--CoA ligase [Deltaproteobacteria bacterium PRO3]